MGRWRGRGVLRERKGGGMLGFGEVAVTDVTHDVITSH